MRAFALLALAALVVAAGAGAASSSTNPTALTVTYWAKGLNAADKDVWTLRCNPAAGTLARPRIACARLAAGGRKLMTPVPAGAICTQIYGGPQVARVVGQIEGKRVFARFTRENGCQIARWNKLSPWLIPPGGVTG